MSIGIYVFLRIYFLGFGLSDFAQFRTHSAPSSTQPPSRSPRVACLVSGADRCSVSSVLACVSVRGVVCLASGTAALLLVLCSRSGCAGVGCGLHRRGIQGEPEVGWSTPRVEKIQKRRFPYLPTPSFLRKTPYPLFSISKIPSKNKKTPTKGLCSVLYLLYKP